MITPKVFITIIVILALTGPILSLINPITSFEITFPSIPADNKLAPTDALYPIDCAKPGKC